MKLEPNEHIVVYLPIQRDQDVPTTESKIWITRSFEDAVRSIEEFMYDGEFLADIECQFEIFDSNLSPVCDQKMVEDLLVGVYDAQSQDDWDDDPESSVRKSVPSETVSLDPAPPATVPQKEEKEVKFSDIKIEDGR